MPEREGGREVGGGCACDEEDVELDTLGTWEQVKVTQILGGVVVRVRRQTFGGKSCDCKMNVVVE